MKIIKNHVTNFKDNEEEYKFLSNFKKGQNKDLYKYFFNKELYYFVPEVVTKRSSIVRIGCLTIFIRTSPKFDPSALNELCK
jgi:hypothetical protein